MEEDREGWGEVSAYDEWICPECKESSDVALWKECEPHCELCGNHDGRECPKCHEWFEHVWDDKRIEEANKFKKGL